LSANGNNVSVVFRFTRNNADEEGMISTKAVVLANGQQSAAAESQFLSAII